MLIAGSRPPFRNCPSEHIGYAFGTGQKHDPQLLHQSQGIALAPMLDNLAVLDAIDVHDREADRLAGGGQPLKIAAVGGGKGAAGEDAIARHQNLIKRVLPLAKGGIEGAAKLLKSLTI